MPQILKNIQREQKIKKINVRETETRITWTVGFGKHWMFSLKPKATATEYKNGESIRQYLNSNESLYHWKKKAPNKIQNFKYFSLFNFSTAKQIL